MSNSGSSQQTPTGSQTTTQALPDYLKPIAQGTSQGLYNYLFPGGNLRNYPNPPAQVAGYTPDQILGMNQASAIAAGGSPAAQSANQLANATEQGAFLYPGSNPFLDATYGAASQAMVNQYRDAIQPQIQSQFAQAGNFGSSAQGNAQDQARYGLGQNLQNMAAEMYGQNYANERQNQLQMAGLIPSLISSQFLAPQELMGIGAQQQQFGQQVLDTARQNMLDFNQWPIQAYQQMAGLIPTLLGNTGTTVTTQKAPSGIDWGQVALGGGTGLLGLAGILNHP